ncbi:FecR family protein [Segatella maculosa]|uniref:FecR family protein n=1 Tax=Segatella maculosa TaxID=439703 RepID=UPI0003A26481|nr:FecR domain-containing protein [Segatella maculosa]
MEEQIEVLYQQYLLGQLSRKEFEQLQRKVAQCSDDVLWDLMCEDFSLSSELTKMSHHSQQKILQSLHDKICKAPHHKLNYKFLRYISMIVLIISLCGSSYWWLNPLHSAGSTYTYVNVKAGSKSIITLPDGTHISLNGNSQLRYNVVPKEHREVVLMKGEAYFDVAKDADCPFRVHVNDMQIEVLGTKFNVRYHSEEVETALFSGAVRLSANGLSRDYRLSPGKKSIYHLASHRMAICNHDTATDARWKEGYLAFSSQPLSEVLREIENWYGVTIHLRNHQLAEDLLTGSFYHESLESVLHSLSMQYGFKYAMNRGDIVIE